MVNKKYGNGYRTYMIQKYGNKRNEQRTESSLIDADKSDAMQCEATGPAFFLFFFLFVQKK